MVQLFGPSYFLKNVKLKNFIHDHKIKRYNQRPVISDGAIFKQEAVGELIQLGPVVSFL